MARLLSPELGDAGTRMVSSDRGQEESEPAWCLSMPGAPFSASCSCLGIGGRMVISWAVVPGEGFHAWIVWGSVAWPSVSVVPSDPV